MGKKESGGGGGLGAVAALVAIGGGSYGIYSQMKKNDKETAADVAAGSAAASRVHTSRITLNADVPISGVTLMISYGTWTIDPPPPPMTPRSVTVKIEGYPCPPAAVLAVTVNDAQLQMARCAFPRGSTGTLTWVVKETEIDHFRGNR